MIVSCLRVSGVGIDQLVERRTRDQKDAVGSPAAAARTVFSLTFCADSYSVSALSPCYCSGTEKTPVILPKVQVAGYN